MPGLLFTVPDILAEGMTPEKRKLTQGTGELGGLR
jgi:hypothetical protein